MKKIATIMGLFGLMIVQAQVGINTDTPKATLDMKKDQSLAKTTPQGVLFPKLTTAERAKFTDVEEGMMIYNLDKKCVEVYAGIQSGVALWNCMFAGTASASTQGIAVSPAGFEGVYMPKVGTTAANKVKFELKNNSLREIIDVDFSGAVTVANENAVISVSPGENKKVSLAAGSSTVLSYSISSHELIKGTLTANFNKRGLQADQSTQVGLGSATIDNKTVYVVSLTTGGKTIQGEINNLPEKMTIEIPYTQGEGSYNAFTNTQTVGQGENVKNLTLDIPAGNFGVNGNLTATITVDGDGKYLVEQQLPDAESIIATFPITLGSNTFNVEIKSTGGIPDRNFSNGTGHDFLYLPVEVRGKHKVNGQPYKKTWLNMNLGAEYAKVSSDHFNPLVSNTGSDAHGEAKTYGSYFQWQRKADGHEFLGSPTTTELANSWTHTSTSFIVGNRNWVRDGQNDTSGANVQLWQSGGANNPCPVGYHVPTETEWKDLHEAVTGSRSIVTSSVFWNQSILPNFAAAGFRNVLANGDRQRATSLGYYWSSENNSKPHAMRHYFYQSFSYSGLDSLRGDGFSVRCIKD